MHDLRRASEDHARGSRAPRCCDAEKRAVVVVCVVAHPGGCRSTVMRKIRKSSCGEMRGYTRGLFGLFRLMSWHSPIVLNSEEAETNRHGLSPHALAGDGRPAPRWGMGHAGGGNNSRPGINEFMN